VNNDILFISNKIIKEIFFAHRDVIVRSFCSLSRTCSFSERCQSCVMTDGGAKSYLISRTSNSSIEVLDVNCQLELGNSKWEKESSGSYGPWILIGIVLFDMSTDISEIAIFCFREPHKMVRLNMLKRLSRYCLKI
jgi:chemotaxis protein CheD